MADYTGIKIFSITLNGATHPTTGTVSSIGEMYVRDIGDTKGTLVYNNGGPTDEETGQTLTVGGTDYTDVTDVTHGTITVGGVEVSGTFLSVLDPNTAAQVDFFIPDETDGEDAELLDVGGAITATALDPASETMDYPDMYATPSHSVVGSGDDTVDAGTGNDSIDAGDGANDIDACDGDDTIVTGDGNDTIDGGAGSDIFDWDGTGDIEITDFDAGTSGQEDEDQDVVDLSKYYADLNDLRADFADDGVLNQSTGDYSDMSKLDGSLTFANDDGSLTADDLTTENTRVTCFADNVMVMTDMGERMVGELGQGDMVLTIDSGYAPVRWIGQRSLDAAHFAQHPAHRPIRIRQGALGPNMPSRDLIVSPQHRVLVRSDLAHQVTGQPEALVAAKHLLPLPGVAVADDMDAVTYVHIMFDQHEVVFSDGLATESFYTGDQAMAALAPAARAEIMAIFPEWQSADFSKTPSAGPFLDGEQGVMLAKAHKSDKRALLA